MCSDVTLYGFQLVARNQELATLYEKLKLQHSLLVKGERSYRDVIAQIKQREAQVTSLISFVEMSDI
jgi:hypothetical protein